MADNSVFGQQVGRYTLLEKLGQGGMAAVYNALDSRIERNVALKVILPSRQTSQVFLERFVIEARALSHLTHTNIVKVLDYGEENGLPYLVMEYIPGGTLKEFMNQPLSYAQAAAILAPIARALDYVHKQKIIHRDVKPSNILIDDNDQPMLSDFGVVKLLETEETDDVAVGVGIGTPDYMSPEQGMGKKVDFRADIYALGVVFYEMITGHKPFSAESPMAVVIKHVTGTFPRPRAELRGLPKIVEDVIMRAVAKDPDQRFSDMGKFAEALEELALGPKAHPRRIRKLLKIERKPLLSPRAQRLATVLAFAAVLVGLVAAAWLNWPLLRKTPAVQWAAQYLPSPAPTAQVLAAATTATLPPTAAPTSTVPVPTVKPSATKAPTQKPPGPAEAPTQTPSATAVPQAPQQALNPGLLSNNLMTLPLAGTPIPTHLSSITGGRLSQIGLWGIGGVNVIKWSRAMDLIVIGTTDGIFVYNSKTLEHVAYINTQDWVETLEFSPDGMAIAAGLRGGKTQYLNLSGSMSVSTFDYAKPTNDSSSETSSPVIALAFSQSKRYLAVGHKNGTISLWDFNTATPSRIFAKRSANTLTGLMFTADSRYLYAIRGDRSVTIWDIQTSTAEKPFDVSSPVSVIVETPDRNYYLMGGDAGTVLIFDPASRKVLGSFSMLGSAVKAIAIAPDSTKVGVGLANGAIKVFKMPAPGDMRNVQQPLYTIKSHADTLTGLDISTDSATLISSSWREGLKTWEAATGKDISIINPNMQAITRMVFSPDGRWLAVEDVKRIVKVWNVKDGTVVQTFSGQIPSGRGFSKDGKYFLVVQEGKNTWEDGSIQVIEYPGAQVVKTLTGYRPGWQFDFSPDGKMLVGGTLQTAFIWDTSTWEKIKIHGGSSTSCGEYYTPDSQLLARIWDKAIIFNNSNEMTTLCATRPDFASPVELLPSQSEAVYARSDGRLWFWNFTDQSLNDGRNVKFISSQKNAKTAPDLLLAVSDDSSLKVIYFDSRDLGITQNYYTQADYSGHSATWEIKDKAEYRYQAALSPDKSILALGTQFGSIILWGVP